jgi:NAD(P)H-flavin reductase
MDRLPELRPIMAADPMLPVLARVTRRTRELADTWTLDLVSPDGGAPVRYAPGQFTMMYVLGVGEIPVSISGDASDSSRLVQTVRAVGKVSEAVTRLTAGAMLGLRGPFGTGWPVADGYGRDVVVVAGGLGLAPLRPALYQFRAERKQFGKLILLYGTRRPEDILFRRQLERWRRHLDMEIQVTVDHASTDWRGHVGVVTKLIPRLDIDVGHSMALICGPEIMMRFAASALHDIGLPDEAIHLSLERNMKCAVGLCGHCQFAGSFICKDGAVMRYDKVRRLLALREI